MNKSVDYYREIFNNISEPVLLMEGSYFIDAKWIDVNEYLNDEEVLDYSKAIVMSAIKSKGFRRANQDTLCHIKKDFELFFPIES